MSKELVYDFMRQHKLAVLSYVSGDGTAMSALVGIAVSEGLEIVFDTVKSSRKYRYIIANGNVSLVIGWDAGTTVQFEGVARELIESDNDYRKLYYSVYPDGRERAENWPGLVHFKVSPEWIRYSNFNEPAVIEEMEF
jgi:general stress protein 26